MPRGKASPSSAEEEGARQNYALCSLEEEEDEGQTLLPFVEEDGNGEELRHRPQKREGTEQGSRLSI